MRFLSAVLGVGSKGGGRGVDGKEWTSSPPQGPTHLSLPRSHVSLSSTGSWSRAVRSRLPATSLHSTPFTDHVESRCFPLRETEPTETMSSQSLGPRSPQPPLEARMCVRVANYIVPPPPPHPTPALPTFSLWSLMPLSLMHAGKTRKGLWRLKAVNPLLCERPLGVAAGVSGCTSLLC